MVNNELGKFNDNSSDVKETKNRPILKSSTTKNYLLKKNFLDEVDKNKINTNKDNKVIYSNNKKKVGFNLNIENENHLNKIINSKRILEELRGIFEEEIDFSFCSNSKDNNQKSIYLSIERNNNFEILSSYPNLNKISKGNYIDDINLQKKIKKIIKHYFICKYQKKDVNDSLSLQTIVFSSGLENRNKNHVSEYENKNKYLESKYFRNKTCGKYDKIKKYNTCNFPFKFNKMKNRKQLSDKIINKTTIKNRKNIISKKILNDNIKNNDNVINNLGLFSTFKKLNSILLVRQRDKKFCSNDIKENNSKTSSLSKQSLIKKINSSYNDNNKTDINKYNIKEIDLIIDKRIDKKFSDDKIIINNISFISNNYYLNNNHKIYKNRNKIHYNKKMSNENDRHIINQLRGLKIPNSNIISNHIITTSSNGNECKDNLNSVEKIKNTEGSLNIFNSTQKNINKNLNIMEKKENIIPVKDDRIFCKIF